MAPLQFSTSRAAGPHFLAASGAATDAEAGRIWTVLLYGWSRAPEFAP